jgi:hypothetical protein
MRSGRRPQGLGTCHGGAPILELSVDRDPAARLALAIAPVTVIERKNTEARVLTRGGEASRVVGDPICSRQREAVTHHHTWRCTGRAVGLINRGRAPQPSTLKLTLDIRVASFGFSAARRIETASDRRSVLLASDHGSVRAHYAIIGIAQFKQHRRNDVSRIGRS